VGFCVIQSLTRHEQMWKYSPMKKQTAKVKSKGRRLEVQKSWMGQKRGSNGSR